MHVPEAARPNHAIQDHNGGTLALCFSRCVACGLPLGVSLWEGVSSRMHMLVDVIKWEVLHGVVAGSVRKIWPGLVGCSCL